MTRTSRIVVVVDGTVVVGAGLVVGGVLGAVVRGMVVVTRAVVVGAAGAAVVVVTAVVVGATAVLVVGFRPDDPQLRGRVVAGPGQGRRHQQDGDHAPQSRREAGPPHPADGARPPADGVEQLLLGPLRSRAGLVSPGQGSPPVSGRAGPGGPPCPAPRAS